jgi:FdhD protein
VADGSRSVDVVRVGAQGRAYEEDRLAVEEPLEIRLHGRSFAVLMRTPGADLELAAGFLLSERVVGSADDLGTIEHCRDGQGPGGRNSAPGPESAAGNIVNVTLARTPPGDLERLMSERRQVVTNSSCGLCGRLTIESLRLDVAPLEIDRRVEPSVILQLPGRLRSAQTVFAETGGLHAAGLFGFDGRPILIAEDVGRHNAVDKVVGRMLVTDQLPLTEGILFVSGRSSFEIVQKAVLGGVPVVASVSAPSSLAIDLARELGVTLVGFVRDRGFNIYAHEERVEG